MIILFVAAVFLVIGLNSWAKLLRSATKSLKNMEKGKSRHS